jgi:hypothetical protein
MLAIWYLLIEATIYMSFPKWAIASPMPPLIESVLLLLDCSTLKLATSCLATAARSVKLS